VVAAAVQAGVAAPAAAEVCGKQASREQRQVAAQVGLVDPAADPVEVAQEAEGLVVAGRETERVDLAADLAADLAEVAREAEAPVAVDRGLDLDLEVARRGPAVVQAEVVVRVELVAPEAAVAEARAAVPAVAVLSLANG
jgi:hypothetical protein